MRFKRTYISIPADEYEENKKAAAEEGRSFSSFARHAMKEFRRKFRKAQ